MVGATSLYDVTLHWTITSIKWLPYYSLVSFAELRIIIYIILHFVDSKQYSELQNNFVIAKALNL